MNLAKCSTAAVLVVLATTLVGQATPSSPERIRAFAALPHWTGVWGTAWSSQTSASGRLSGGDEIQLLQQMIKLLGHPPYNAEWEARHQQALGDTTALAAVAASAKECTTGGFPSAMDASHLFQIVVTPEQTLVVFDNGETRHIYTDGRDHPAPEDLWPTAMGDSIGHWEGDTLVVETIARTPGPLFPGPSADLSAQARFVERIRQIDPDTLENQMMIEDPERFTEPWNVTLLYSRIPDLNRLIAWSCTNDRHPVVNGKLTIAPPADTRARREGGGH